MGGLKSLAKETAIYGVSSIVGRFLNYLLVPVYTIALPASSGGYGVVTNIYAWVALMLVLLTCGMETGFFRFANKGQDDPMRVYSTTLLSVSIGSVVFVVLGLLFLEPIAGWLEYGEHPWYIGMMMIVVAMDAIQSIPFAYLRYKKRPIKFAALKLLFIFLNIALNLFYYVVLKGNDVGYAFLFNLVCTSVVMLCMIPELRGFTYVLDRELLKRMLRYSLPLVILGVAGILNQVADKIIFPFVYPDEAEATVQLGIYGAASKIAMIMAMFTQAFRFAYEPFVFGKSKENVVLKGNDVGYAFLFNLVCTSVVMLCMIPELRGFTYVLDRELLKRMLRYSLPLVILGVAGILNQVADKIIFPFVYPDEAEATVQLGIYGAASKIAMIMAMFTQAFRFAYEPFVFGKSKEKDSREMYAQAMKFFIIFTLLAFLAVMFYLDILRHIIGHDYWDGLRVVPIVMAAEIFMGIYFNLSFWYKLIDETRWGAYFSLTGCTILILMNIFLIPKYGYIACAWAGFTGYGVAMLLSYFVGQKKYPIQYDLKAIGMYVLLAAVLYLAAEYVPIDNIYLRMAYRTVLLILFIAYVVKRDLPLNQIPILNRIIRH